MKKTVPLPLEIVFRPGERGVYNCRTGSYCGENDERFQFHFELGDGCNLPVEDPWGMREDILVADEEAPVCILDGITLVYGRWGIGRDDLTVPSNKLGKRFHVLTAMQVLEEEYEEWVHLIRAAMVTKMSEWPTLKVQFPAGKVAMLCEPMTLSVEWRDGRPTGIIPCAGILRALIATLQIDALIGAEYRFCACIGCNRSFKVKRQHQRYCGDVCKHRQVVRDSRNKNVK